MFVARRDETGKKALEHGGVARVVKRRGLMVGRSNTHPHKFRHKSADAWLDADGDPAP